jgi:Putative lumazine-binding
VSRKILTAALALSCLAPAAHARRRQQQQQATPQTHTTARAREKTQTQDAARTRAGAADAEREAVKRVVETYLHSEEADERKRACDAEAKIFTYDERADRLRESRLSRNGQGARGKVGRSRQQVVHVDVAGDAATVRVETELSPGAPDAPFAKHAQYVSLLKFKTGWKIVAVLMPPLRPREPAGR